MAEESQALARFYDGWKEDGIGPDGLPLFTEVLMVKIAIPPYTSSDREPEPSDFEQYAGPYQLYEKEKAAAGREPSPDGYPLALWPACSVAHLKMLVSRDIVTVEQLAKHAGRGVSMNMPAGLKQLAERAAQMIRFSSELGQFEVQLRDRDAVIEALKEQVAEFKAVISAKDAELVSLRLNRAA